MRTTTITLRSKNNDELSAILEMPALDDEIMQALKTLDIDIDNIDIDDIERMKYDDQKFYIGEYNTDLDGQIKSDTNLIELNNAFLTFESLPEHDQLIVKSLLQIYYDYNIVDAVDTYGCYLLDESIHNAHDLGYNAVYEDELIDIPESIKSYINLESLGRDLSYGGSFTKYGYLTEY